MDLAGSEKCSSFSVNFSEDGLKGWQLDEMQDRAKDRIKEGQYINKSLFFLTQVINKKSANNESNSHVPYRNTALTKMLKSSLGGNSKTCVILCISPAKSQFEHSLATLKFGLNVSKIENKANKNIEKTNSEETLRLLIQEYQNRLVSLENNGNYTLNANSEIKAENDMLWQQFVNGEMPKSGRKIGGFQNVDTKDKILLQFYVDQNDMNEEEIKMNPNLSKINKNTRQFIDALKLSCKLASYWKSKYSKTERKLNDTLAKLSEHSVFLTARNMHILNLSEITEDCLKALKCQSAKLEIYENTEKWAQALSQKDLNSLMLHFKTKLDQINNIIQNMKQKSNKKPNKAETPKFSLKLKHDETYINNLLKEGKSLTNTMIPNDFQETTSNSQKSASKSPQKSPQTKENLDEYDKLLSLLKSIKDSLPRLPSPAKKPPPQISSPKPIFAPTRKSAIGLSPIHSTTKLFPELTSSPMHPKIICHTPNAKKSPIGNIFENRKIKQSKAESRSTSSSSRRPIQKISINTLSANNPINTKSATSPEFKKLGHMINKAIKVVEMQKPEKFRTPRDSSPEYNGPPRKETVESYDFGIFSHAQSMKQLKKSLPPAENNNESPEFGIEKKPVEPVKIIKTEENANGSELLQTWQKLINEINFP